MHDRLIIAGESLTGSGPSFDVIDPVRGEPTATIASAGEEQVVAAVAAARAAFPAWRDAAQQTRSDALLAAADLVEARSEELLALVTADTGRAITRNRVYVAWTAFVLRQYAHLARHHRGRVVPSNDPGQLSLVLRSPYGVVAAIAPYNYPLALMVHKVAPALAAGNTVVLKGAPETTRTTQFLAGLLAEVTPPGVVNAVVGGREVGEWLVNASEVDLVAFTGSTSAGRAIGEACAMLTRPVLLELGGKDPAIVFADADLEVAVPGVVWSSFLNTGQVCTSTERVYVARSRYAEFVEAAAAATARIRVGDPFDPATEVGPMRTEAGRARVIAHIRQAEEAGARVVVGGDRQDPGFWLSPALVADVDHTMSLMNEETFGPVLPVMAFDEPDDAFALAADTPYGLGASIYTGDARLVKRSYDTLPVGNLWVNEGVVDNPAAPFGGVRASGAARELGIEGLDAYTYPKHVHWNVEPEVKPWWFG
ncbi:MAG: aldehyde dehydrogenase family protein [Acidimicrobiia bacterium]|nr:MAG: aldehyde dehydrogenase family protein [Acidimicrobiia bacterium]